MSLCHYKFTDGIRSTLDNISESKNIYQMLKLKFKKNFKTNQLKLKKHFKKNIFKNNILINNKYIDYIIKIIESQYLKYKIIK
jgi:hypothetical protein